MQRQEEAKLREKLKQEQESKLKASQWKVEGSGDDGIMLKIIHKP